MRLPWSIRAGVVGGALVALAFLVYWMARAPEIRRVAMDRMDDDLKGAAYALSAGIGPEGLKAPDLDARVKGVRRDAGLRFTVIAEDGRVVADSDAPDLTQLANHATRPEVVAALRDGSAFSSRTSDSVNRALRYAAVRIPGTKAIARAALDAKDVDATIAAETHVPWPTGLLATLVASLVAGLLLAPTAAGVRGVAKALAGLEHGALATRVPVRGPDFLRGLSAAFNSMAERLQADVDRVNAERARLATVLDGLVEGVFAIDAGENVGFLNRAARVLLGVGADDKVEGRPIHHLVRDPQLLALVRTALSKGESHEAEIVWDGAPKRLLHVRATPVGGGRPGAILLVGDVSTIRRLERMRSDFVANVSHEFRTPLSAIAGAAETLLDGAMTDTVEGPRFVGAISRQADRLTALVDDLLTLSRLESAPEAIERVPVDFGQVVRQSCEAVAAKVRDGELRLEVHADGALRVLGDPEALRRLVDNLVVNAVTYTPTGGWVRVGLAAEDGRAVLTVADSGIGIPAEHIERIFERFYRVDKARSRSKGGTGLGLAIVKHSVNLHGGEISVQSRPGAGSTFTVSIPLPKDADLPATQA